MQQIDEKVTSESDVAEFYVSSRALLIAHARRYVSDLGYCEDIVAESYLSIVERVRKGKGPALDKLEAYAKVCVRNEAFRQGKAASHELPTEFVDTLADSLLETVEDSELSETWDEAAAARAFHKLSERSQKVLWSSLVEDKRLAEIAGHLGINERAVASAAFRARENLRLHYLVEASNASHKCGEMRVDFLANYVQGQSSQRREKKIEDHLGRCLACRETVGGMRSLGLPTFVILGIAVTAAGTPALFGGGSSAQAATFMTTSAKSSWVIASQLGGGWLKIIAITGVGLLAAVSIWAVAFWGVSNGDSSQRTPGDTNAPLENPVNGEEQQPKEQPLAQDQAEQNVPELSGPLPAGVRKVSWAPAPSSYVAGGTDARILLSVDFDQETKADDYTLVVVPPAGVTLTKASAGCTISNGQARCIPQKNLLGATQYNWQFFADLTPDSTAKLPVAQLTKDFS